MAEGISGDKGDGTHPKKSKHSDESHHLASSAKQKESNQTAKTSVEGAETKKNNIYKPTCILHGLGHDVNP